MKTKRAKRIPEWILHFEFQGGHSSFAFPTLQQALETITDHAAKFPKGTDRAIYTIHSEKFPSQPFRKVFRMEKIKRNFTTI